MTAVQQLPVPDWVPGTAGPIASPSWTVGAANALTRVGLQVASSTGDVVVLLGSANLTDPISAANPNVLGTFLGGTASQDAGGGAIPACFAYAVLRYPPPHAPGTARPTTALVLKLQGA